MKKHTCIGQVFPPLLRECRCIYDNIQIADAFPLPSSEPPESKGTEKEGAAKVERGLENKIVEALKPSKQKEELGKFIKRYLKDAILTPDEAGEFALLINVELQKLGSDLEVPPHLIMEQDAMVRFALLADFITLGELNAAEEALPQAPGRKEGEKTSAEGTTRRAPKQKEKQLPTIQRIAEAVADDPDAYALFRKLQSGLDTKTGVNQFMRGSGPLVELARRADGLVRSKAKELKITDKDVASIAPKSPHEMLSFVNRVLRTVGQHERDARIYEGGEVRTRYDRERKCMYTEVCSDVDENGKPTKWVRAKLPERSIASLREETQRSRGDDFDRDEATRAHLGGPRQKADYRATQRRRLAEQYADSLPPSSMYTYRGPGGATNGYFETRAQLKADALEGEGGGERGKAPPYYQGRPEGLPFTPYSNAAEAAALRKSNDRIAERFAPENLSQLEAAYGDLRDNASHYAGIAGYPELMGILGRRMAEYRSAPGKSNTSIRDCLSLYEQVKLRAQKVRATEAQNQELREKGNRYDGSVTVNTDVNRNLDWFIPIQEIGKGNVVRFYPHKSDFGLDENARETLQAMGLHFEVKRSTERRYGHTSLPVVRGVTFHPTRDGVFQVGTTELTAGSAERPKARDPKEAVARSEAFALANKASRYLQCTLEVEDGSEEFIVDTSLANPQYDGPHGITVVRTGNNRYQLYFFEQGAVTVVARAYGMTHRQQIVGKYNINRSAGKAPSAVRAAEVKTPRFDPEDPAMIEKVAKDFARKAEESNDGQKKRTNYREAIDKLEIAIRLAKEKHWETKPWEDQLEEYKAKLEGRPVKKPEAVKTTEPKATEKQTPAPEASSPPSPAAEAPKPSATTPESKKEPAVSDRSTAKALYGAVKRAFGFGGVRGSPAPQEKTTPPATDVPKQPPAPEKPEEAPAPSPKGEEMNEQTDEEVVLSILGEEMVKLVAAVDSKDDVRIDFQKKRVQVLCEKMTTEQRALLRTAVAGLNGRGIDALNFPSEIPDLEQTSAEAPKFSLRFANGMRVNFDETTKKITLVLPKTSSSPEKKGEGKEPEVDTILDEAEQHLNEDIKPEAETKKMGIGRMESTDESRARMGKEVLDLSEKIGVYIVPSSEKPARMKDALVKLESVIKELSPEQEAALKTMSILCVRTATYAGLLAGKQIAIHADHTPDQMKQTVIQALEDQRQLDTAKQELENFAKKNGIKAIYPDTWFHPANTVLYAEARKVLPTLQKAIDGIERKKSESVWKETHIMIQMSDKDLLREAAFYFVRVKPTQTSEKMQENLAHEIDRSAKFEKLWESFGTLAKEMAVGKIDFTNTALLDLGKIQDALPQLKTVIDSLTVEQRAALKDMIIAFTGSPEFVPEKTILLYTSDLSSEAMKQRMVEEIASQKEKEAKAEEFLNSTEMMQRVRGPEWKKSNVARGLVHLIISDAVKDPSISEQFSKLPPARQQELLKEINDVTMPRFAVVFDGKLKTKSSGAPSSR